MDLLAQEIPEGETTPYPRRWYGLAVLCLSLMVILMANMSISVAAVNLTIEENLTSSQFQWIIDGYTVPYASLMLLVAILGDKYGRRLMLNLGLVILALGAVYGGFIADSAHQIIAARFIMGIGAAFIMPSTLGLLVAIFPKKERAIALTIWSATAGIAIVTGPLVAGYLLKYHSWPVTFVMNIPPAIILIFVGLTCIPPSKARHPTPIDYFGSVLSVVAVGCTVYSSIEGPHNGWGGKAISAAVIAGVSFIVFILWELACEYPLLQLRKFRNRYFSSAVFSATTLFFVVFGAFFGIIQLFQFVYDLSPLATGVRLLPIVGTVALGGLITAIFTPKVGMKIILPFGLLTSALALYLIYRIDGHPQENTYSHLSVPICLVGLTLGLCISPSINTVMGSFIEDKLDVGGALNDTAIELGGSLGVAALGSVLSKSYTHRITDKLNLIVDGMHHKYTPQVIHHLQKTNPHKAKELLAKQQEFTNAIPAIKDSVGVGSIATQRSAGSELYRPMHDAVYNSFSHAFSQMSLVGMFILIGAAVIVFVAMPAGRGQIVDLICPEYDKIPPPGFVFPPKKFDPFRKIAERNKEFASLAAPQPSTDTAESPRTPDLVAAGTAPSQSLVAQDTSDIVKSIDSIDNKDLHLVPELVRIISAQKHSDEKTVILDRIITAEDAIISSDEKLASAQQRIQAAQQILASETTANISSEEKITAGQEQIAAAEEIITAANAKIAAIDTKITALDELIAAEKPISDEQRNLAVTQVTQAQDAISQANIVISAAQAERNAVSGQVAAAADLTNAAARIASAADKIAAAVEKIAVLEQTHTGDSENPTTNKSSSLSVSEKDSLSEELAILEQILGSNSSISALIQKLEALEKRTQSKENSHEDASVTPKSYSLTAATPQKNSSFGDFTTASSLAGHHFDSPTVSHSSSNGIHPHQRNNGHSPREGQRISTDFLYNTNGTSSDCHNGSTGISQESLNDLASERSGDEQNSHDAPGESSS